MAFINQGRHIGTVGLAEPATEGGIITSYGAYTVHTFLNSGTFTFSGANVNITGDILSVAGGAGGGGGQGGGGAGGMVTQQLSIAPGVYNIIVGGGGPIDGIGFDSKTNMTGETVALGGGMWGINGGLGGSGAGGGRNGQTGAGTAGQGNNGGSGSSCNGATGGGGGGGGASGGGSK